MSSSILGCPLLIPLLLSIPNGGLGTSMKRSELYTCPLASQSRSWHHPMRCQHHSSLHEQWVETSLPEHCDTTVIINFGRKVTCKLEVEALSPRGGSITGLPSRGIALATGRRGNPVYWHCKCTTVCMLSRRVRFLRACEGLYLLL